MLSPAKINEHSKEGYNGGSVPNQNFGKRIIGKDFNWMKLSPFHCLYSKNVSHLIKIWPPEKQITENNFVVFRGLPHGQYYKCGDSKQ